MDSYSHLSSTFLLVSMHATPSSMLFSSPILTTMTYTYEVHRIELAQSSFSIIIMPKEAKKVQQDVSRLQNYSLVCIDNYTLLCIDYHGIRLWANIDIEPLTQPPANNLPTYT